MSLALSGWSCRTVPVGTRCLSGPRPNRLGYRSCSLCPVAGGSQTRGQFLRRWGGGPLLCAWVAGASSDQARPGPPISAPAASCSCSSTTLLSLATSPTSRSFCLTRYVCFLSGAGSPPEPGWGTPWGAHSPGLQRQSLSSLWQPRATPPPACPRARRALPGQAPDGLVVARPPPKAQAGLCGYSPSSARCSSSTRSHPTTRTRSRSCTWEKAR